MSILHHGLMLEHFLCSRTFGVVVLFVLLQVMC